MSLGEIPIRTGHVTVGYIGNSAKYLLLESRQYSGFWFDYRSTDNSVVITPMPPEKLTRELARRPEAPLMTWRTEIDDIAIRLAEDQTNAA